MINATDSGSETQNISSTNWTAVNQFPEYRVALIIWKIWPPCILLLGGFGNIATIFVMRRIKDGNSSQRIILMALAVSDLSLLYLGALRQWLNYFFHVDVYNSHTVMCKLYAWLIYFSCTASAWLLTCVTVQRTMAIKWPHKMRMMCTLRRTCIIIVAIVFTTCALHFHWVLGMDFSRDSGCIFVSEGYKQFVMLWGWVDLCLSSLLPSFCLLVCDVILSLTLFKAASSLTVQAISNVHAKHDANIRRKTASKTTVMILALSCTFLVLTLPVCVFIIWQDFVVVTKTSRLYARGRLARAVTFLLWYTNSAVNFLLYCFTGTKFRKEFLSWVSCSAHSSSSVGEQQLGL